MSAAFTLWFEQHGAGMSEADARKVWNAAISEAHDLALERALELREKSFRANDLDAAYASAKSLEAHAVRSIVFGLRAAA